MARSFDPVAVLKTLSRPLLRKFLDVHYPNPDCDVPWTLSAAPRRITFLDEWMSLPEQQRERMQLTLQEIFHLSCEDGMRSLSTELRAARPESLTDFNRLPHRLDQASRGFPLHQIAHGARAQAALGIDVFVMHGVHKHEDFRMRLLELLDQIHTTAVFQRQVEDDQVRLQLRDFLQRRVGVFRVADELKVFLTLKDFFQPLDDDGMVVEEIDLVFHGWP